MSATNTAGRIVARAAAPLALWYVHVLQSGTIVDEALAAARRQARPRRRPWQPKTMRDYVDAYRVELAALARQQGATLLEAVQRQSQPRRWPWQPKTIRDLIDERSAELTVLAAERSAELAAAVAARKDALVTATQQQVRPRRWPWQPKTLRDRVSERSVQLATVAAERSEELAALARARRDALLKQARRQGSSRRWPWQPKTARDRLKEQSERSKRALVGQVNSAAERLKELAEQSSQTVRQTASATSGQVQQLASAVPRTLESATSAAAGSLHDAAQRVSTTADAAAAAAQRPVSAVSDSVQAGRRTVRRGVRLFRTALWATLIGVVIGLLFATTSGEELRRQLRRISDQLIRGVRQPDQRLSM
jgi:gas vesicle protein